jgi:hypothetical protein
MEKVISGQTSTGTAGAVAGVPALSPFGHKKVPTIRRHFIILKN